MSQPVFWNQRYGSAEYAYGESPNVFLAETLSGIPPGRILFPGEGEGRNAVYAARLGWLVDAFDQSEAGRKKAQELAQKKDVRLSYQVEDALIFEPERQNYDAIALVFFHLPEPFRQIFHKKIASWLKPGGLLILEAFHKNQFGKSSGGPQLEAMLWDRSTLENDFSDMKISYLEEKNVLLEEGRYHQGEAAVIRMLATR